MASISTTMSRLQILITGAYGFLGKNLSVRLSADSNFDVVRVGRSDVLGDVLNSIDRLHAVVHLAGENRPSQDHDFHVGNTEYTEKLCRLLQGRTKKVPVLFSSSIQAEMDNPYGRSKRSAEEHLMAYAHATGASVFNYRLPNVFGKWCKPHYNSVIATFCANLIAGKPLRIDDPDRVLELVYVDDVVENILSTIQALEIQPPNQPTSSSVLQGSSQLEGMINKVIEPHYQIGLQQLADVLSDMQLARKEGRVCETGSHLTRALHATWLSYLPTELFKYSLTEHEDSRGRFSEFIKTPSAGQVSFFTAGPGITRGGHYHHTKTEKFLVVQGLASFRFRHMDTGETVQLTVDGTRLEVVETVPGWAHDITNTGKETLIVVLWANEVFDQAKPDTFYEPLDQ